MTTKELFARIPEFISPIRRPVKIEGWCTEAKAFDLVGAVLTLRPSVCVEIGVFGGMSLIPIALALRTVAHGQIIGIDPWNVEESIKGQTGKNLEWWSALDHEAIYKGFIEAVNHEGVANQVVVLRQTSDQSTSPKVIDFFHGDGNHGEQALRDVQRFGANVRVGGLCFLDDIGWDGGAVGNAAEWLINSGFVELYKRDTGAMFQRVAMPKEVTKRGRPKKKAK